MVPGGLAFLVAGIATILVHPVPSFAQNGVTPGQTRIYSTIYSVGVEWDLSGDFNHNATVNVQYRIQGASAWKSDRKSTRLNSSHGYISYAVFCLKKKKLWHLRSRLDCLVETTTGCVYYSRIWAPSGIIAL